MTDESRVTEDSHETDEPGPASEASGSEQPISGAVTSGAASGESPSRWRRWLRRLGWAMVALTLMGLAMLADAWTAMGATAQGERRQRMEASAQYRDGRFVNVMQMLDPEPGPMLSAFFDAPDHLSPIKPLPVITRSGKELTTPPDSGLRVTWMGHSTMLIEIDGRRVLTDPVWGERCSPGSFYGPSRFHEPPLPLEQLPSLDAIIISHDHYDHLDAPTIKALADVDTIFLAPLGVGAHLEYWGVPPDHIHELDWWDEHKIGDLTLTATPARHFSGRGLLDRNATLWASWAITGPRHRVFFSGDTGMFKLFEEIGARLGPFDMTMIEVGAYNRLWRDVHLGPEQAVEVHKAVRGKLMLPVHWGTFNLALHNWTEPAERLMAAAEAAEVTVAIPRPGESVDVAAARRQERWWPEVPWQTAEQDPVESSGLD